ncbi:MAG: tRNA (guanine(37)-N1)-methyltransferase [Marteilia pararefringens]
MKYKFTMKNIQSVTFDIGLKNWKINEAFTHVLPRGVRYSSFTQVGHIAQMNLHNDTLPYKYAIADILLEYLRPWIRTVLLKTSEISNEFRFFDYEVLAGAADEMECCIRHLNCTFHFDFSKVYWNTRLVSEHTRVVNSLTIDDFLFDACAGVGPFAIPASRQGVNVYANDLNPECVKWLEKNADVNPPKKGGIIKISNLDASLFISQTIPKIIEDCEYHDNRLFRIVMNLPDKALEFLESFRPVFERLSPHSITLSIYIYCFSKNDNLNAKNIDYSRTVMEQFSVVKTLNSREVRDVAPNKKMFCIEILASPLPNALHSKVSNEESIAKKLKIK